MERLATPLAALNYDAAPRLPHIAHWLEDRYIRQLATDARGPLRQEQPQALGGCCGCIFTRAASLWVTCRRRRTYRCLGKAAVYDSQRQRT